MKELKELAELEVRVGFQRDETSIKKSEENSNDEKEPLYIIDYALWNEMGVPDKKIPSRPFMRDSMDKHIPAIEHALMCGGQDFINGASARTTLETIGVFQKDVMQTEIKEGDFIENAYSTKKRKRKKGDGSIKPLIDNGDMRNSVNFWIGKKGSND